MIQPEANWSSRFPSVMMEGDDGFMDRIPVRKPFICVLMIQSYDAQKKTSKGSFFASGTVYMNHQKIPFKVWEGPLRERLAKEKISGIYDAAVHIAEFNGEKYLELQELAPQPRTDLNRMDFVEMRYQPDLIKKELNRTLKMLSPEALEVFYMLTCSLDEYRHNGKKIGAEFLESVAACSHHDACICGLAAHSMKIFSLVQEMMKHYPTLTQRVNQDVLYLGILLHDIGKVVEYEEFGMSEIGQLCSHLSLGVEMLALHKPDIIDKLGEDAYYRLQSVITQHHGPFGDAPRTVEAYLVHKADLLESQLQALEEQVEDGVCQISVRDGDHSYKLMLSEDPAAGLMPVQAV